MTPRRNPRLAPRALPLAIIGALLSPLAALAGSGDWLQLADESATRISAAASIGISDPEEKDLASGDVDKDGDTDLVVVRKIPFSVPGGRRNVLFMNENGVMTDRTTTLAPDFLDTTDDRDVALVDVDGDSWLDVVVSGTFGEQPRLLMNLGTGVGGWLGFDYVAADHRLPTFSPAPKFCSVSVGDVTGDNAPDLFFTDYDNNLEDRLLINDGDGFFTDQTASRMTPAMSASVFGTDSQIVDFNGDGFKDVIKNNASGSSPPPGFDPVVTLLYNDGTGHFNFKDDIYNDAPYMIEAADFTQDGRMDLFVVDDGQDQFLINTGNDGQGHANFSNSSVTTSPATSFFGGNVKYADLDQDGVLDVMIADADTDIMGCDRRFTVLRGLGTPPNVTFGDPLNGGDRPWLPVGTFDIEALHVDDDGVIDLWIGTCDGNRVFMGKGPGIFLNGFESGDTNAWSNTVP